MSVHSNHYEDPEEYERDLRSEYAREEYEQTHGIPFYYPENDDPDCDDPDRDGRACETCKHFIEHKMYKRIIESHFINGTAMKRGKNGVGIVSDRYNELKMWVTTDWRQREMTSIWICEKDKQEHFDDDFCEEYEVMPNETE